MTNAQMRYDALATHSTLGSCRIYVNYVYTKKEESYGGREVVIDLVGPVVIAREQVLRLNESIRVSALNVSIIVLGVVDCQGGVVVDCEFL